jgi:uncharacterized membrane protein
MLEPVGARIHALTGFFVLVLVLVLSVSGTRTRWGIVEYEYEYHFIEYEYDRSQKRVASNGASRVLKLRCWSLSEPESMFSLAFSYSCSALAVLVLDGVSSSTREAKTTQLHKALAEFFRGEKIG